MEEKKRDYTQLSDPKWLMDLAFLVDMLSHLDKLNLDLQGKFKNADLVQTVFAVTNKLKLFNMRLEKEN